MSNSETLNIRLTQDEKSNIKRKADENNLSLTAFIKAIANGDISVGQGDAIEHKRNQDIVDRMQAGLVKFATSREKAIDAKLNALEASIASALLTVADGTKALAKAVNGGK